MSFFQHELLTLLPVVRAYALIVTRQSSSAADDLVQDTLEKAWRAQDQFQPGTSMKAWLFTILRNSQHNEWRRSRRLVEDPEGAHAATLRSEPAQGWRIEFLDVLDAIERLDPASRQALLLVTAGLSYEEVAIVCESPLRTVQSRVRRARQRLAAQLEPEAKSNPGPEPEPRPQHNPRPEPGQEPTRTPARHLAEAGA
ncbi:sigma-70 family RNA polymerase sigma factor [Brevundimonas sp.]|uniref:sigma-70 family RNA polymerase sigma factor n=1 Tax=Brevundimonas sp. TaxID=1871086 RepID=UPI002731E5EB|nr:sigma-70 family RNA polymerase sigma factor [Brevundimonas sp.]